MKHIQNKYLMKIAQLSWLLSCQILLLFSTIKDTILVDGQCLNDQRSHLWHFKNSLEFDLEYSTKLGQWNLEDDCCSWRGVVCDAAGRVTALELDSESITGAAYNFTNLFKLQFLEKLNLGDNYFAYVPIPKAIENLTNLVNLNLSHSGFDGQIPMEISSLRKLVSLDLSYNFILMEKPTLKMLIQNLSNMEELYLDGVDLSAESSEWSQVIATSLPKLRVLSLVLCDISGPIHTSLSSIHNLSVIRLDYNNISAEVPEFFANMPYLRTLSLSDCNLVGQFPVKIFQVQTLQSLDISYNGELQGSLPSLPEKSSLRKLALHGTKFSGSLPNSIGNLHMLSSIDLAYCGFSGTIPAALAGLSKLSYVDLSFNNFSGPIPQFQLSNNLVHIDISNNSLTGPISNFKGLQSLETLDLQNNFLSGRLPSSFFKLPALTSIDLLNNQFSGQIVDIPGGGLSISQTRLVDLNLRSNQFNGSFPKFIFELKELTHLDLSFNSFTDTIQLEAFKNLPNLTDLDLSNNEITGEIPNWIWNLDNLNYLNLSLNSFVGLQQPYNISSLDVLDLHSNQLKGELPSRSFGYVDLSLNNFSGPIPLKLNVSLFMSLSDNSLTGSIPNSTCSLAFLDLSNNSLIGHIPSCLVTSDIKVLNLAGNNLNGSIPDTFLANCTLKTLELGMNNLQGKLPRTLSHCTELEVLNLGHNKIDDVFPCMFENSSSLRVLVLKSNKFHGELEYFGYNYSWPQLQIVDIASNNLRGVLSSQFFSSLKLDFTQETIRANNLGFTTINQHYYQFKVGVTMKGLEMELEKILTIFTSIDFSNNTFSGKIPESIGDLKALYVLDLSHNEFTGGIPSSIGKLSNLGSLDLSRNQLAGEIPSALKDLTFLSYLNLSFNMLTGKIPIGSQLQTFVDAYMGNVGLCGFPLNVSCGDANDIGSSAGMPMLSNKREIDWMYICASLGYTVGLGIFSMLLLFCERWRNMFFLQIDQLLVKVFGPVWRESIRRLQ